MVRPVIVHEPVGGLPVTDVMVHDPPGVPVTLNRVARSPEPDPVTSIVACALPAVAVTVVGGFGALGVAEPILTVLLEAVTTASLTRFVTLMAKV